MRRFVLCCAVVLCSALAVAETVTDPLPLVKVEVERLPDLHIARGNHSVFLANGELVVIGGHTTGFVPTATAEYFSDRKWHLLNTIYTHDMAASVKMKSGKILVAGGALQPLGIGQTFSVETYDPATHLFESNCITNQKRMLASAAKVDSGRVLLVGNNYWQDAIELFNGRDSFRLVGQPMFDRNIPFIFRTSAHGANIFGSIDSKGRLSDGVHVVERLEGDTFHVALFKTWRPLFELMPHQDEDCFIGNEAEGYYAYLFPVENAEGQVAVAMAEGEHFSLLPTSHPVPMNSQWGKLRYRNNIIVDRHTQRAWLVAADNNFNRLYAVCIEYGVALRGQAAPLSLNYTDEIDKIGITIPLLDAYGNIVFTGGVPSDNFNPISSVYVMRVGSENTENSSFIATLGRHWWLWLIVALALVSTFVAVAVRYMKRRQIVAQSKAEPTCSEKDEELMDRLDSLMREEQPYKNPGLKIEDVATRLGVSQYAITRCLRQSRQLTFYPYINNYRVQHAQQLLLQKPPVKTFNVYTDSGFSSESSYFRIFKSVTGMTPGQWMVSGKC